MHITSGWIPLAILALFAAALVDGQARANLPNEIKAAPVPAVSTSVNIVLNAAALRQLEALPQVVDTLLVLPSELAINIDAVTVSPFDRNEHSSRSK